MLSLGKYCRMLKFEGKEWQIYGPDKMSELREWRF